MNYNACWDFEDITDESTGDFEEPVSIEEFKDYMRLEGYIDTDESTADDLSDFDFDDPLIAKLLKKARIKVEKKRNVSLVAKTGKAMITNLVGGCALLYPPIGDVISLLDSGGNAITSYNISGNKEKRLMWPCYKNMTITYETLASDEDYSIEIMREAAYLYEHRGDEEKDNEIIWTII